MRRGESGGRGEEGRMGRGKRTVEGKEGKMQHKSEDVMLIVESLSLKEGTIHVLPRVKNCASSMMKCWQLARPGGNGCVVASVTHSLLLAHFSSLPPSLTHHSLTQLTH